MADPVLPLILGDGTTVWVRLGDLSPEARAQVSMILGYPGSNELAPWFSAGGPGRIADGYELLRREVNAHSRLLDGLMIGARHNAYAGNLAAVNRNRSKHTLAQHLRDPLSDAVNPIPPALEVYQSILSDALSVDGIRAVMTLGRWGNGAVTQAEAILLLEKRLTNGATDAGPWIRTTGNEFMVNAGGGIYCRGGLLVFGNSSNVILRGGHVYVEDGGVVATLGPGVISDTNPSTITECSLAMARTSDTTAQIGDLYGIDVGTLTLQASVVRALSPDGTDSAFKSKGLIIETDPLPSFFTASNRGIGWDSDDNKLKRWDGSTYEEIASGTVTGTVLPHTCEGRLTSSSTLAVSDTAFLTPSGTLYFLPFAANGLTNNGAGGKVALYTSSTWTYYDIGVSGRSLSLTALTLATVYDIFLYDSGGTPTLEAVAWTSATARATALETQDGVLVKSGARDRRYLGSIYTSEEEGVGSGVVDSPEQRHIWNANNRVRKLIKNQTQGSNSWNYTTATWRQAAGSGVSQVDLVQGLAVDAIDVTVHGLATNTLGTTGAVGVGLGSSTVNSAQVYGAGIVISPVSSLTARYAGLLGIGYRDVRWLEISTALGVTAWYGDNGLTYMQSGIMGTWWC